MKSREVLREFGAVLRAAAFRAGPPFALAFDRLREAGREASPRGLTDEALFDLLSRHLAAAHVARLDNPVAVEMEAALGLLDLDRVAWSFPSASLEELMLLFGDPPVLATLGPVVDLVASTLDALLHEHLGRARADVLTLDPCAGNGFLPCSFANESSILAYYAASLRFPGEGLCYADTLGISGGGATMGLDFFGGENAERVRHAREAEVRAIVARPPARTAARLFEWAVDRLRRFDGSPGEGVVAFVTDAPLALGEGNLTYELDLREAYGVVATFLVRKPGALARFLLPSGEPLPASLREIEWDGPSPEPPDWEECLPIDGGIFAHGMGGVVSGRDAWAWDADRDTLLAKVERTTAFYHAESARLAGYAGRNAVRKDDERIRWSPTLEAKLRRRRKIAGTAVRGLYRPFSKRWLYLDPVLLDRPERWVRHPRGSVLLLAGTEALVTDVVPDCRALGTEVRCFALADGIAPSALVRFRAAYGPGVTDRNVFDYAVALLHHPEYRGRYGGHGLRLPLLSTDALGGLLEVEDAPPVGEGTAFGTGWTPPNLFEPGTVPDYDDPFASPYARGDVDPGFLLFVGLGAALGIVQTAFDRIEPYGLSEVPKAGTTRVSKTQGKAWVAGREIGGIPEAAFDYEVGGKSSVAWTVADLREEAVPAEEVRRALGQAVAVAVETQRLADLLGTVSL